MELLILEVPLNVVSVLCNYTLVHGILDFYFSELSVLEICYPFFPIILIYGSPFSWIFTGGVNTPSLYSYVFHDRGLNVYWVYHYVMQVHMLFH